MSEALNGARAEATWEPFDDSSELLFDSDTDRLATGPQDMSISDKPHVAEVENLDDHRQPPESVEGFNPQEVGKWYAQINRNSVGDYLSEIDKLGAAELNDEVLALLALYATTRKRRVGIEKSLDILDDSLKGGNAPTARTHDVSISNVGARRSQAAAHIARELDKLNGLIVEGNDTKPKAETSSAVSHGSTTSSVLEPRELSSGYVGDDHLKMHLNAIGRVPLLNAELEVELSKRIEAGLVAQHILDSVGDDELQFAGELKPSEEELEWLAQDGRAAFDHFILANTRLAVSIARKYGLSTTASMQIEDRIQVGNEALFRAVQKFDYKKGYKFSTYATWWLRQGIQRAVADESKTIRIPIHMTEKVSKVTRFRRDWLSEHSTEATPEEIGEGLKMKIDDVEKIIDILRMQPASLNLKIGEGDTELADILDIPQQGNNFDNDTTKNILLQNIRDEIRLSGASEREIMVIERRFGVGTGEPETLDMIAGDVGVTRERIRQIEAKIKNRLRLSPELRQLYEALTNDD